MNVFDFSLFATIVSVYRGEHSIIDYAIGGAMAGGIYKANLGLAAVFVGATLGNYDYFLQVLVISFSKLLCMKTMK